MRHRLVKGDAGFTLIELSIVMLIMGLVMLIGLPNLARSLNHQPDFYKHLSGWLEVIMERSGFRSELFLIEIDPKKKTFAVVQPAKVDIQLNADPTGQDSAEGDQQSTAVQLNTVSDPFFPSKLEMPEGFEIDDIQGTDGKKTSDSTYYLVVYPYGWIDPVTLHIIDEERQPHTGFINAVTGRIRWQDDYSERIVEEDAL